MHISSSIKTEELRQKNVHTHVKYQHELYKY